MNITSIQTCIKPVEHVNNSATFFSSYFLVYENFMRIAFAQSAHGGTPRPILSLPGHISHLGDFDGVLNVQILPITYTIGTERDLGEKSGVTVLAKDGISGLKVG